MSLPDRRQWTRSTLATFQRRLAGFVSLALGDVGNLGANLEHDLFNAAPDHKIATRRTPRRHRGHGCECDAHKLIDQRIDIRMANKLARFSASLSCSISVLACTCSASACVRTDRRSGSRNQRR